VTTTGVEEYLSRDSGLAPIPVFLTHFAGRQPANGCPDGRNVQSGLPGEMLISLYQFMQVSRG
jgi:hypothetical protein